jgi:predicted transcriptional regulator
MKKFRNERRLFSALVNLVCNDQLEEVKNYSISYNSEFESMKYSLLLQAVKHNSKNCAEWIFENSENKTLKFKSLKFKSLDCKFDNILENYNFSKEFSEKYDLLFTVTKKDIISRILSIDKVANNSKRVDYLFHLIKEGFITYSEVNSVLNTDYAQLDKRLKVIALLRELKLIELGI